MNCAELENYLHEFVDNELARDKRTEVANHLASCRRCAVNVAKLEQADRELKQMAPVEPPEDFLRAVRNRIESDRDEHKVERVPPGESIWARLNRSLQLPVWAKVPIAAAAALAIVLAALAMTRAYRDWQERKELASLVVDENDRSIPKAARVIPPAGDLPAKSEEFPAIVEKKLAEYPRPEPMPSESEHALEFETPRVRLAEPNLMKPPPLGFQTNAAPASTLLASRDTATPGKEPSSDTGEVSGRSATPATNARLAIASAPAPAAPVSPLEKPAARSGRARKSSPEPLAKVGMPALTNRPAPLQSGWLDLGTGIFYAKPDTSFTTGGYVRGRLDERDRLTVTSTQVEGMIEPLAAKEAAARGTPGWLELTSLRFVPSRPGLAPSFPYVEGYQDDQGEFHPISRTIYRAGD